MRRVEQGHADRGIQSSADLNTDRSYKTRAKMAFFTAIRPVWPVIAAAFKELDTPCYKRYMAASRKLKPTSYLHLNLVSLQHISYHHLPLPRSIHRIQAVH